MKVLFSPIGNSDPWRNYRDGAMLHIVRHYQPEVVVLYFTQSIWDDSEYRKGHQHYDWEKIITQVSPHTKVEQYIDSIDNAQDFDSFKEYFHQYLQNIHGKYPDAEVLLNVTSGTPQMEATLCLEYIVYPKNKRCIQVTTPVKGSNVDVDYANPHDVDEVLKLVEQNEVQAQKRFREIDIISFREAMVRSQLLQLIENYDYEAASTLLNLQDDFRNQKELSDKVRKVNQDIKSHRIFPEISDKYNDKNLKNALQHNLLLKMRLDRGDIAEVLIRVKSIAEYIVEYYIKNKYPDVIKYKKQRPKLNKNNASFMMNYKLYVKSLGKNVLEDITLGLPSYLDILAVLEKNSTIHKQVDKVMKINNLRNSVAHYLEPLKVNDNSKKQINAAVKGVEILMFEVFPDIDIKDLNLFEKKNNEIRDIL